MTLQLLHSEFPYIWGKLDFLFYQCIRARPQKPLVHIVRIQKLCVNTICSLLTASLELKRKTNELWIRVRLLFILLLAQEGMVGAVSKRMVRVDIATFSCAEILEQSIGARNRVGNELSYLPASLCSLAGRYDNPIPTGFLAHRLVLNSSTGESVRQPSSYSVPSPP